MKRQIFGDASGQTSAPILTVCLTQNRVKGCKCFPGFRSGQQVDGETKVIPRGPEKSIKSFLALCKLLTDKVLLNFGTIQAKVGRVHYFFGYKILNTILDVIHRGAPPHSANNICQFVVNIFQNKSHVVTCREEPGTLLPWGRRFGRVEGEGLLGEDPLQVLRAIQHFSPNFYLSQLLVLAPQQVATYSLLTCLALAKKSELCNES